ncbi:MAG: HpyAIV family type II restriction enzyme, partial [Minisyncoccia bacterium]
KESLPELPEINFDSNPERSFEEIKNLELRFWRKILENDKLWEEGIIKAIFRQGITLRFLLEYFNNKKSHPYTQLAEMLSEKIKKYYQ